MLWLFGMSKLELEDVNSCNRNIGMVVQVVGKSSCPEYIPSPLDGYVLGVSCYSGYTSTFSALAQSHLAWVCFLELEFTPSRSSVIVPRLRMTVVILSLKGYCQLQN